MSLPTLTVDDRLDIARSLFGHLCKVEQSCCGRNALIDVTPRLRLIWTPKGVRYTGMGPGLEMEGFPFEDMLVACKAVINIQDRWKKFIPGGWRMVDNNKGNYQNNGDVLATVLLDPKGNNLKQAEALEKLAGWLREQKP